MIIAALDEDRGRPCEMDGCGTGYIGMGRNDDLVAAADAGCLEGDDQCIGAVGDPKGVFHAQEIPEPLFEVGQSAIKVGALCML